MVHQRCLMGLTSAEVARRLSVNPTTVTRTVQLFEETGTVCNIQGYHENTHKKLSLQDVLVILRQLLATLPFTSMKYSTLCCRQLENMFQYHICEKRDHLATNIIFKLCIPSENEYCKHENLTFRS